MEIVQTELEYKREIHAWLSYCVRLGINNSDPLKCRAALDDF